MSKKAKKSKKSAKNKGILSRGLSGQLFLALILMIIGVWGFSIFTLKNSESLLTDVSPVLAQNIAAPNEINALDETTSSVSDKKKMIPVPSQVTAKAVAVYDEDTKQFLMSKNSDVSYPPASITKLLTALVVMDNLQLDQKLTVPYECTTIAGNKDNLIAGSVFTVEELMKQMLVTSASDSTCTLVTALGQKEWVYSAINQKAEEIGMYNTHLTNTIGFDDPGHFSQAQDLIKLGQEVTKSDFLRGLVATKSVTVNGMVLPSTNVLLGNLPGIDGVKTGSTLGAGECLLFHYNQSGRHLMGVVMGSKDRFTDTKLILQEIESNQY